MNTETIPHFFKEGEKSESEFRIGLEWELFIVNRQTLQIAAYFGSHGIESVLKELSRQLALSPIYEDNYIKSLDGGSFRITLEPGGQIELSGRPFKNISDCEKECSTFVGALSDICSLHGLAIMPFPYHPTALPEQTAYIPNKRYGFLTSYFSKFGLPLYQNMQKLTTSVQVSIDYYSEQDFSRKILLAYLLAPVLSAMYSNSPFVENRDSGYSTYRGYVWDNTDNKRCGFIDDSLLKEELTYKAYADVILDLPIIMGFGYNSPEKIRGITLREHIKNSGDDFSVEDWTNHLSFFYNVVRAKKIIELRCFDNNQSLDMVLSVPAIVKGIFYTGPETMSAIEELFSCCLKYKLIFLKRIANIYGLEGGVDDVKFIYLAQNLYKIAERALESKYPCDVKFLFPLKKYLFDKKCSPSREILELWQNRGKNILNIKESLFCK